MLTIVTWLWGDKYSGDDVRKLRAGFRRHLKILHKFVCATDRAETFAPDIVTAPIWDMELTRVKGCFARLRMFDPEWQGAIGGSRFYCCDLDAVVTGPLDTVFDRSEPFVILQGVHAGNPCPYNGSLWGLSRDYRPDVWSLFTVEAAGRFRFHEHPDDQGWMASMIDNAAAWKAGPESGVYGFQKPGWPRGGEALPADARLVVFPGWRSPERFKHLDWVRQHWVA